MSDGAHSGLSHVVIVGGGFSGTMVAYRLVRDSHGPLAVTIVDREGLFGRGNAYSTEDPVHLLNVPAARMSAFPEEPDHFLNWLREYESRWRPSRPWLAEVQVTPLAFLPRRLYGLYLQHLLREAEELAQKKGIPFELAQDHVLKADAYSQGGYAISLQSGRTLDATAVVLALGNAPSRPHPCPVEGTLPIGKALMRFWPMGGFRVHHPELFRAPEDLPLLILGTGLTAVDAILSLAAEDFRGPIWALSRNGLLPQVQQFEKPHPPFLDPETAPDTIINLVDRIREEVFKTGVDRWRSVLDSLRAVTPEVFRRLKPEEKEKFFSTLLPYWNVLRHRVPPQNAKVLEALSSEGRLRVQAGSVLRLKSQGWGILVEWRARHSAETQTTMVGRVFNCTGPELILAKRENALLRHLIGHELLPQDANGTGIRLEPGTHPGRVRPGLYALGPLYTGEILESTAVPEIRGQAKNLAAAILEDLL